LKADSLIAELGGVVWRNNKSKMVPVILAALGESTLIRWIRRRIEHPGVSAVPRYALPFR
jgi:hypothetical protein